MSASSSQPQNMGTKPPKLLSCSSCRQRKIKCDKTQPVCVQCSRFGHECVFPSRKQNRRAPRPRQRELLDRISRLESIVGQADPQKLIQLDSGPSDIGDLSPASSGDTQQRSPREALAKASRMKSSTAYEALGAAAAAKYLSSDFWRNLSTEVEGIKHALDQPSGESDSDEFEDSPASSDLRSLPSESSGRLLGNSQYHQEGRLAHPPPYMRAILWDIYQDRIDPVIKILHRPTVNHDFQAFVRAEAGDPGYVLPAHTNSLFFCIYFCAATCLTQDQCQAKLGESWEVCTARYRILAERALGRADYLNTNELVTVQALVLYVSLLRLNTHDRSCWTLTALALRVAMGNKFHRDGDGSHLSPYMAEMRRRVWQACTILDIRGSEDRGSEPIILTAVCTTQVPTRINDDDFGPNSTSPLVSRPLPTDNVITLATGMACSYFLRLTQPDDPNTEHSEPSIHTEAGHLAAARQLEAAFIHTEDENSAPSVYASLIAKFIILRLFLVIQYPNNMMIVPTKQRVNGETMLRTAISCLEQADYLMSHRCAQRFNWLAKTFVQWHPLAVALAELCTQTEPGPLTDEAWRVVDREVVTWKDAVADTSKGPLWRPIRKLLRKAREARNMALMQKMSLNEALPAQPPPPPHHQQHQQIQQQQDHQQHSQNLQWPTQQQQHQQHQQAIPLQHGIATTIPNQYMTPSMHHPISHPLPQLLDHTMSSSSSSQHMVMGTPSPYDFSSNLNPSYLFEYPAEFSTPGYDTQMGSMATGMHQSLWGEFLQDAKAADADRDSVGDSV